MEAIIEIDNKDIAPNLAEVLSYFKPRLIEAQNYHVLARSPGSFIAGIVLALLLGRLFAV